MHSCRNGKSVVVAQKKVALEALVRLLGRGCCGAHGPCSRWACPERMHMQPPPLMCCVCLCTGLRSCDGALDRGLRAATAARCTMRVRPAAGGHKSWDTCQVAALALDKADAACPALLQVGVPQGRLRKWLLSVAGFLRNQNGSVAEAIALWQRNVVKEFEGVEECLICYTIVAASNGKLPKLQCHTCSKRFHAACLYKWFQSSGKSNCPHCQSPW